MSEKPSETRRPNGQVRDTPELNRKVRTTLGFEAFKKISAVEGIAISRHMKRDILAASAEHLSPSERSRYILARYGKK